LDAASCKGFTDETVPEVKKLIWPPQAKLRSASSLMDVSSDEPTKISNKFSQSSFYLNEKIPEGSETEAIKAKKRKWYKMFMPPKDVKAPKAATKPEEKLRNDKRPWYKKNKKEKSKEKLAIAC
jgi:hypothetical protein